MRTRLPCVMTAIMAGGMTRSLVPPPICLGLRMLLCLAGLPNGFATCRSSRGALSASLIIRPEIAVTVVMGATPLTPSTLAGGCLISWCFGGSRSRLVGSACRVGTIATRVVSAIPVSSMPAMMPPFARPFAFLEMGLQPAEAPDLLEFRLLGIRRRCPRAVGCDLECGSRNFVGR